MVGHGRKAQDGTGQHRTGQDRTGHGTARHGMERQGRAGQNKNTKETTHYLTLLEAPIPLMGNPISCSPSFAPKILSNFVRYFAIPLMTE